MSIHFKTKTPNNLLKTFKKAVDEGHVTTWSYDKEGDFTHKTEQWKNLAWLRPKVLDKEELILYIIKPKNKTVSKEVYAIYHGRFIESMLAHCDTLFLEGIATAEASKYDIIN